MISLYDYSFSFFIKNRRWDAKFNEFLFLEKFMFVSYFLVIFHDYFIIDSF